MRESRFVLSGQKRKSESAKDPNPGDPLTLGCVPSVQCGEADTEDIGDLIIGHAAFAALAGDFSHLGAIDRFATSSAVTEATGVAERRAPFLSRRRFGRFVHKTTLARSPKRVIRRALSLQGPVRSFRAPIQYTNGCSMRSAADVK
jgi:hypothetical protein